MDQHPGAFAAVIQPAHSQLERANIIAFGFNTAEDTGMKVRLIVNSLVAGLPVKHRGSANKTRQAIAAVPGRESSPPAFRWRRAGHSSCYVIGKEPLITAVSHHLAFRLMTIRVE